MRHVAAVKASLNRAHCFFDDTATPEIYTLSLHAALPISGPRHETGLASIVSAGTADAFVTHEVARTLEYLGWTVRLFEDCGVAGLWRIQAARDDINKGDVVVVCAGLDAALASVMGGLTSKPVFAVPTSVGYGIAEGGRAALSSCLASCAPGVAVMNIDNGYGAACAAARVLTLLESVRAAR